MDALALLRLHIDWGADEALLEAPVARSVRAADGIKRPLGSKSHARDLTLDQGVPHRDNPRAGEPILFAEVQAASRLDSGGAVSTLQATPAGSPAERAAAVAAQASSLADLRASLAAFDGCALRDTAANLVFASGDPEAGLLLIGDPPTAADDRGGVPFSGSDGALLDRMLASIGLARGQLLLTPLIPWRPPGGRPPSPGELQLCLHFLHRLIVLAAPQRILLVGTLPARVLGGGARRRTPDWLDIAVPGRRDPIPALVLPSPVIVARTPSARRDCWAALRLLRRTLVPTSPQCEDNLAR